MAVKLWNLAPSQEGNGIFIDSNGYIHVTCYGGANTLLYAISTDNGATFTDGEGGAGGSYKSITISNIYTLTPAIVVNSEGDIFIFYSYNAGGGYYGLGFTKKLNTSGEDWSSHVAINTWKAKRIIRAEIDSDDNLIVISTADDGTNRYIICYTSIDKGANWVNETDANNNGYLLDLVLGYNQHLWTIHSSQVVGNYTTDVNKITKTEGTPDSWVFGADENILGNTNIVYSIAIICERDSETIWEFISIVISGVYYIQYNKKSAGSWGGWNNIISNESVYYKNLQVVRTYDNNIYLIYEKNGINTLYYVYWNGSSWSVETEFLANAVFCNIQQPDLLQSENRIKFTYKKGDASEQYYSYFQLIIPPEEVIEGDTITLSDEIELNVSREKLLLDDNLNLSDEIELNVSREKIILEDTINLSDEIDFTKIINLEEEDTLSLSDEIYVNIPEESEKLTDNLSISDEIELQLQNTKDLISDFRMMKQSFNDVENKFSFVRRVLNNIVNIIFIAQGTILNIANKINTLRQEFYNIKNDIRTKLSWQVAGDAGVQSLGKEYIKVYIDSVEITDVDIDSISISKVLNSSHTATFELARQYDSTKPDLEAEVEIKYHIWTLYKGYITQITPADSPEHIRINCQDEYWEKNKDKVYFNVGHKPTDDLEVYYSTISAGLSACGVSFGIGNFIPQTIGLFGSSKSDAITNLVTQSGNYSWYYKVDKTPKLWKAGLGDIINIDRQEIGKNIGIYQIISHQIKEDVESIVNKYRVQMGQKVIRRFNSYGGTKQFTSYEYRSVQAYATRDWNANYEILAKNSSTGEGRDWHNSVNDNLYADVFRKYRLPNLDKTLEEWTDRYDPEVHVRLPFGGLWKCSIPITKVSKFGYEESQPLRDGFTIDYENQTLVFNQPLFLYQTNQYGEKIAERAPEIKLWLWKKRYYSNTDGTTQNPTTDIANPLMFFTNKMGDYPETIIEDLNLSNLSIQTGFSYTQLITENGVSYWRTTYYPSWDDTNFARDYANWQLSQKCDTKINGTIDITLDMFCYYGIELNNRIMINNILDNLLNIQSITLNISSFTASIQLQNGRVYNRSVSIQSRGE